MTAVEERRLEGLLKAVVAEVLAERQELRRDTLREGLADRVILRAIQPGEKSAMIGRKTVFRLLQPAA